MTVTGRITSHPLSGTWGGGDVVKVNGFWSDTCNGPKTFVKRGPVHQMAFSKRLFNKVGGYPEMDSGEDRQLYSRFLKIMDVPEKMRDSPAATMTYNNCQGGHVSWSLSYKDHGDRPPSRRGVVDLGSSFKVGADPTVNIITNTTNGAGLQRHALILKDRFTESGFRVRLTHFQKPETWVRADLNLSVEVIRPEALDLAPINWFMPMPEWYYPDPWNRSIGRMSRVLCNTRHGVDVMGRVCKPHYLGFESRDIGVDGTAKQRRFLHVAGLSINKNTQSVVDAWVKHKIEHPLTVVCARKDVLPDIRHPNIRIFRRVDDALLNQLQRSHWFHLCVSKYEGWGHYIHEATSCGGLVITHDKPPLNEFPAFARVPAAQSGSLRMAPLFEPNVDDLAATVDWCASQSDEQLHSASVRLIDEQRKSRDGFRDRFKVLCEGVLNG